MLNKKISDYLREKKVSQAKLAKDTGISQQNLNRLLNSDDIKISHLHEITKALGLPITFFFDGKEDVTNEEIESYKNKIHELEHDIQDYKKEKKGFDFFFKDLAAQVLKANENDNNELVREISKKITFAGAILGLLDTVFTEGTTRSENAELFYHFEQFVKANERKTGKPNELDKSFEAHIKGETKKAFKKTTKKSRQK